MKLAVCLITADRPQYTLRTLETFVKWNERDGMILLHADDGSAGDANRLIAKRFGFRTVYASQSRLGVMPALGAMWLHAIMNQGATHILHLENDCVSVRPLPDRKTIECCDSVRLYGKFKDTHGNYPTGPHHMETKNLIEWELLCPGWEQATCHWGAQPSITEAPLLYNAWDRAKSLKDISRTLDKLLTLRPLENITSHIGVEKTTGARFHA